jgi:hypothetical protein
MKYSYPPQPVSVLRPATALLPSFLLAQAIFKPKLFPYKYSTIFKPSHLHTYPPTKMEQCSETSQYKIQAPGNYPEEYNIYETLIFWTDFQEVFK